MPAPRPILHGKSLSSPLPNGDRVFTTTKDPERIGWLAERYGPAFKADPRLSTLKERLLGHGGWDIVPLGVDPQLDLTLSEHGTVWSGEGARMTRGGQGNRCHGNVAMTFLRRWPSMMIGTGYALLPDGVWLQHSWLFEHRGGKPVTVRETTVPRSYYAGVVLDPDGISMPGIKSFLPGGVETFRFVLSNIDSLDEVVSPADALREAVARKPELAQVIQVVFQQMETMVEPPAEGGPLT